MNINKALHILLQGKIRSEQTELEDVIAAREWQQEILTALDERIKELKKKIQHVQN